MKKRGVCVLLVILLSLVIIMIYRNITDVSAQGSDSAIVKSVYARQWSYIEWQEHFPEQKQLIASFDEIVQMPASRNEIMAANTDEIRIAAVFPAIQQSDYWTRNVSALEKRLEEIGIPYSIEKLYSQPGEVELMQRHTLEVMQRAPDYLLTTLDETVNTDLIEMILKSGRTKVILLNITTPLARFGNRQPLLYTGFDHRMGTHKLAEYFKNRFPDGAKWVLLLFTDGVVSRERGDVFKSMMAQLPQMELLSIYKTEGRKDRAKIGVMDALNSYDSIDFFYSCATDITMGAIEALKETNNERVTINGWGGGSSELDALLRKEIEVTVMRMNDDTGVAMAEAIRLDLQGRTAEVPVVYSGSFRLVAHEDVEIVNELKTRAFRYSSREDGHDEN